MARISKKARKVAQMFEFPAMRALPPPDLPLEGAGLKKYLEIARQLLDLGKLTNMTRSVAEQYAVLHQENLRRYERGQAPSVTMMTQMAKMMADLQLVEQSNERPAVAQKENRYARFGIITRHRA